MRLPVKDGEGEDQTIVVNGVAETTDRSGAIEAVNTSQELMAANADRGGWLFQNLSTLAMWINELDDAGDTTGSFLVQPGQLWPPTNYPVTLGAIAVSCDAPEETDPATLKFTAREW